MNARALGPYIAVGRDGHPVSVIDGSGTLGAGVQLLLRILYLADRVLRQRKRDFLDGYGKEYASIEHSARDEQAVLEDLRGK